MSVTVRFPPSPTGYCHVGTGRMALLNYLFAKKRGGKIIYRSEDTDKERSKPEFEADITDAIQWLGLSWDAFYRQSERIAIYREKLEQLIADGAAYISEEESKKEQGKKIALVRLRNPGRVITFADIVRGEITFDTTELGDFAIARAIDDPLYHFSVVVDDALMGITHVIRGEEHISNTPRQILIQEAFGFPRPQYAHYPLSLGTDRSKLSKRNGDVALRSYRERGFLPQALVNYLAVVGWTPPSGREFLSLEEMIAEFELEDLHKSGAVFDIDKLRWFNRHYLTLLDPEKFEENAVHRLYAALSGRNLTWNDAVARKMLPSVRERISVWEDIDQLAATGEFDFFFADPRIFAGDIPEKKSSTQEAVVHLQALKNILEPLSHEDFAEAARLKEFVWPYAEEKGRGAVLWPLRYALSGRAKSPDPFTIASIVGKETTMRRLAAALDVLNES